MTKSTSLFIATTAVVLFALTPLADAKPGHRGNDGDTDHESRKEHVSRGQGRGQGNAETRRVRREERASERGIERGRPARSERGAERGREVRRDERRSERVIDRTRRDRGTWSGGRTRDARGDSRYRTAPAPRDGDGTRYRSRTDGRSGGGTQERWRSRSDGRSGSGSGAYRGDHRTFWPQYRARSWSTEHRTWYQRGGYRGYRIPRSWFSIHFGRRHPRLFSSFEIRIIDARPQFECEGYWFTLLDPVPEYWAYDWYETDEISIVELEDGYYMVNEEDPDVLLAIDVIAG